MTAVVTANAAPSREPRPLASAAATTAASSTRDMRERSVRIMNTSETATVFVSMTEHHGCSVKTKRGDYTGPSRRRSLECQERIHRGGGRKTLDERRSGGAGFSDAEEPFWSSAAPPPSG